VTVNNILPMKFRVIPAIFLLFLFLLPCIAAPACAALFTISSSGNGVFALQGAGLTDVAAIDATISYDTATLANPRVVQGGLLSGATMMANTNSPGVIRLGFISAKVITGSGLVATINFDRPGESAGKILSLNTVTVNVKGAQLAAQSKVINPAEPNTPSPVAETPPSDTTTASEQPSSSPTETASGSGQKHLSAIDITSDNAEPPKQQPASQIPQGQPEAEAKGEVAGEAVTETAPERESPAAESPAASHENKIVAYQSVLERFREFKGEKTPKSLGALFDAASIPGVRQEPAIALSDGKTRVKISIQNLSTGKEAPNFALKGAKLIALEKKGGAWLIEALPEMKAHEAAITVLHDGSRTDIPLTVAPPLEAGNAPAGGLSEAGFKLFLKQRGTDKSPRFDLNGDGVRNYIDDYIFTANHILKISQKPDKLSGKKVRK
jgi:hypothetical protein